VCREEIRSVNAGGRSNGIRPPLDALVVRDPFSDGNLRLHLTKEQ
jgi:hypothetical protein